MHEWAEVVTLLIAVYGAGLATYTAVTDRREKKRVVQVKLSNGFLDFGGQLSDLTLFVEASNPGLRPVTITTLGILLPDGEQAFLRSLPGTVQLPHVLSEGESCRTWVDARLFAEQLPGAGYSGVIKLRPFADDATGKRYTGKYFKFNVDEWLHAKRRST